MREKRIKVNQVELQVQEYENDGEPIIFLHFSGANLMMWQRAVPFFKDKYRLILADLRGHGKSGKPSSGYRIDEMAGDVVAMMQLLKIEQAHIIGSSQGAEVGLSMAANHPEKVLSLVCDGASSSEYGPYSVWEGSKAEFENYVEEQLQKIRDTPDTVYASIEALVEARKEILGKLGWWNKDIEEMERYGAYLVGEGKYSRGMSKQAREIYMKDYFYCQFEEYYKKVDCPMLMLVEKDADDDREKAAREGLFALARQGKLLEVSGWMHPYGWMLHPEDACKAILKFLADTAHK